MNGIVNPAVCTGCTTFAQILSPFDTAPATNGPLSLSNLQVQIGAVNTLQNTLNYGFEHFIEQVSVYEKINQSDLGLSCGLINHFFWNNGYRVYYVDCSKSNIGDMNTPQYVIVSFTYDTNIAMDVYISTEYFREFFVDVETGNIE